MDRYLISILFGFQVIYASTTIALERVPDGIPIEQFSEISECIKYNRAGVEAISGHDWVSTDYLKAFKNPNRAYDFFVRSMPINGHHILAQNKFGGRSFIFSTRWHIARLVYKDSESKRLMKNAFRLFFEDDLTPSETVTFFEAVPIPHQMLSYRKFQNADTETKQIWVQRTLACYVGDFLEKNNLNEFVSQLCFEHDDEAVRGNAQCSVLSFLEGNEMALGDTFYESAKKRRKIEISNLKQIDPLFGMQDDEIKRIDTILRAHRENSGNQ